MEKQAPSIAISVRTAYLPARSSPDENRYFFAYTITIRNDGDCHAQLLSRHWIITDADGNRREVRGEGVVGQQPVLAPGESFEYTSGTYISTPIGTMKGSYQMIASEGRTFDAEIPEFVLSFPRTLH
ncbi:MAG: Co2+/Mg2+ efflux protein ApaG [Gammaproteobacteria bacterium]|nr:Co2+/Mg2+ efflux protein ApaG [Gammaproteobacteria bacterium]